MKSKTIVLSLAIFLILTTAVFPGEKTQEKTGQPYQHQWTGPRATYMEPDPIRLHDVDCRMPKIYFRGDGFDIDDVDLETVRVLGNIPPYSGPVQQQGGWLATDVFLWRFIARWRPLPCESFRDTFTVEFDLTNGEHIVLEGEFGLEIQTGDLDFDGYINIDDVVFLTEYLYEGGPICQLWDTDLDELMDIDCDGGIDTADIDALMAMVF